MKKLKIAAFIDGTVLLLLIMMAIAINNKEAYGLASLAALGEFVFCFLLACTASVSLAIILLAMLILYLVNCNCKCIEKPLSIMFKLKFMQLIIQMTIALLLAYIGTKPYLDAGMPFTNDVIITGVRCCFFQTYIYFIIVGLCSSLFFIIMFLKSGIKKAVALLLWFTTIFPIIDIAVIAALRYQPRRRTGNGSLS